MNKENALLRTCFLFWGVENELDTLVLPEAESFTKGEAIYTEYTYRRALGILLSGKAAALPGGGGKTILNRFSPGAVFGAAAVFSSENIYVSRIVAESSCRVLFLDEPFLRALFRAHPKTAENYIVFLSERIRFLNEKVTLFTKEDAEGRVYDFLRRNGGYGESMAALARRIGIGRTTLYRTLNELEQKKMLVRKDGKIEVL